MLSTQCLLCFTQPKLVHVLGLDARLPILPTMHGQHHSRVSVVSIKSTLPMLLAPLLAYTHA